MYQRAMSWFLVKMVFQIICGEGHHKSQFDEQLRLVLATDANAAIEKLKNQVAQEAIVNELVQWKLIAVTDIYPFNNYLDGAELFSKVIEEEYGAAYIHTQQLREKEIYKNQFFINH